MSELDNNGRATFAAEALATYYSETRSDPPFYGDEGSEDFVEAFGDLLGDLQHLAKRAGVDFANLMIHGTYHFECEVEEEEAMARQEALKRLPLDEQVYEALEERHLAFSTLGILTGIEGKKDLADALRRLHEAGRAEMYPGVGWRKVTVPLPERILAELTEEFTYVNDLEERLLVPTPILREELMVLREAGKAEVHEGRGWRRTPVAEAPTDPAPDPAQAPPQPAEDALREIAVHLALSPEWDSETTDGIVEVLTHSGLPSVGDMEEVEYWITEAQRLGVWRYYEDTIRAWAEHAGVKLAVFSGETDEALEGQGS